MDKICYLILVHDDPENLDRLIERLDYNADFYIHIDKKVKDTKFKINKKNVFFTKNRVPVFWGGFNMVQATLNLLNEALKKKEDYTHIVLLSGNDYPIKNSKYIYNFFQNNKEKDFIKGVNLDKLDEQTYRFYFSKAIDRELNYDFYPFINFIKSKKINKSINVVRNRTIGLLPNKRKKSKQYMDVYLGSQWWALKVSTIESMLFFLKKKKTYFNLFEKMFVPDEKFFHTLYFNLRPTEDNLKSPITINSFEDRSKQTSSLSNIHIIHPTLKKWYTLTDLDDILSSNKLFVRKVSTEHSIGLLDAIDNKIHAGENSIYD